jgi:hypothetical protein
MEKKPPSGPENLEKASATKKADVSQPVKPLSLDEKLKAFDPAKHGGEYMVVEPVGLEVIPR